MCIRTTVWPDSMELEFGRNFDDLVCCIAAALHVVELVHFSIVQPNLFINSRSSNSKERCTASFVWCQRTAPQKMMNISKMQMRRCMQVQRNLSTTVSNLASYKSTFVPEVAPASTTVPNMGAAPAISPSAAMVSSELPVSIPYEFYVPKAERGKKKLFNVDYKFGEERLMRNDRICPTRELNFTPDHWKAHKSPYRKLRHLINIFRSSSVQRLAFPDLFSTAVIAAGLTYYNEFVTVGEMLHVDTSGFAGATTAIGLLAGFRLNASYGRYEECRIFWGETINTTRDLAGNTMMWVKDKMQQSRMLKLIKAYPICYNFHVNRKGGHHNMLSADANKPKIADRIQAEFQAELRDIYTDGKHEEDYLRLCQVKYKGGNVGLEALTCMRETIAGCHGTVDPIYVREMDEQCQRLCGAFGASERVLRTPMPTGFTRHMSRLLIIWSWLLPFAMYPAMGPFGTLPAAVLTAYAILGIADIGVQLEEPFDILPLRQYSDGIFDSINQIERNYVPYHIATPPTAK